MDKTPARETAPAEIRVIGGRRSSLFRDFYHAFIRAPWGVALGLIVAGYLVLNGCFALAYAAVGGISGARDGSVLDAFFFSVQTMGTIGYGAMSPASVAAHALVVVESVTGLLVTAVATGLVFSKFARSTARIVFSRYAAIAPWNGVPTLVIRIGNERGNQIVETEIRLSLTRTERTAEGMAFYRFVDLALTRSRAPALSRAWMAMHQITPDSPFYGQTPESIKQAEVELTYTVVGMDDTLNQIVHARKVYLDDAIVWGARPADILSEQADGNLLVDLNQFHGLVPTEPTAEFPYSAKTGS